MLLAGAAVAAATWQRAGIVELHEPGDGGSAGLFGAAHGAELGCIFWYWPSAGEAPNWRYWAVFFGIGLLRARPRIGGIERYFLVLACPGWGPEGTVLGDIFWYWPFRLRRFQGVESAEGSSKLRKGKRYWADLSRLGPGKGGIGRYFFGIGLFSAGLDVLSAFFGWDFVNLCVVLAFF